jgi:hypothetical protein
LNTIFVELTLAESASPIVERGNGKQIYVNYHLIASMIRVEDNDFTEIKLSDVTYFRVKETPDRIIEIAHGG